MDTDTRERILTLLDRSDLYEGTLELCTDRADFWKALNNLKVRGWVERYPEAPHTWRLTDVGRRKMVLR